MDSSKAGRKAAEILGGMMLSALALAACGSGPEGPSGPDPEPGGTGGGTSLVFADSALRSAVEQAAAGTGNAAGLVSLTAKERGIADLAGIEQLTRLEVLDLYGNEIRDLSPLAELRRLRYLDLGANRVEEVSALASLKGLQVLLLADNAVTDLSALADLDSLQSLDLTGNPLSEEALSQAAALLERGVTVEFTAPEPEGSVEVVPPEGPGPPLGDSQLLFSSNRRLKGSYLSRREVHSLDLETGEVVNLCSVLAAVPRSDGSEPDSLEQHYQTRNGEEPARSPDGTRVVFASFRDGNREIYVMDADGGHPVNLTRHDAYDSAPAWSPDGRRIAFESKRAGTDHIFVMNADGSGVEQLTSEPAAPVGFLAGVVPRRLVHRPRLRSGGGLGDPSPGPRQRNPLAAAGRPARESSFVVARRSLDRLHLVGHCPRVQPRLCHDRRRHRRPAADLRRDLGQQSHLVARRHSNRLRAAGGAGYPLRHLHRCGRRRGGGAGDRRSARRHASELDAVLRN